MNIECRYSTDSLTFGETGACIVQNKNEFLKFADIIVVRQPHLITRLTNDEVKAIQFDNKAATEVSFFPSGLKKTFANLEWILFEKMHLKEIHQCDLKPFGDRLRILSLAFNDLQVIEKDLLKFNTKMEEIYFYVNKIVHIDANVLDHLQNSLQRLFFHANSCEDVTYAETNENVRKMIKKINAEVCDDETVAGAQLNASEAYCEDYN
jgi:hypothetical protein